MNVVVPWYGPLIEAAATHHGLPPDLVAAVVLVESSGLTHAYRYEPAYWLRYLAANPLWQHQNPRRVSASYGLMQVMVPTAHALGFRDEPELLFVPTVGLDWGCRELARLCKWAVSFDAPPETRLRAALAAYNGGPRGNRPVDTPLRNDAYTRRVEAQLVGTSFADLVR